MKKDCFAALGRLAMTVQSNKENMDGLVWVFFSRQGAKGAKEFNYETNK
jgi:hypothetical protein